MAGFVDDECGALGFLLSYLFGFDCGGEFGREGKVLGEVSRGSLDLCGMEGQGVPSEKHHRG